MLFAGQVLAHAAMIEGLEVLWIPSYGPEMRGGAAACTVIIGDEPIGSPVVNRARRRHRPDAALAPEVRPPRRTPGSLLVVNEALVAAEPPVGAELLALPCTRLARAAGDDRLVSIVALGAALARRPDRQVWEPRAWRSKRVVGAKHPELLAADLVALDSGLATSHWSGVEAAPSA